MKPAPDLPAAPRTGPDAGGDQRCPAGSPLEVLWVFLKLGLSCFGGPVAHIGYFRDAFVVRRRWLDESAYAELVGLCQFLPGPASSQVGFSIGLLRAGYPGALAAWTGFTLPSALALVGVGIAVDSLAGSAAAAVLHGLKLVAVAIVAQAVWGMARALCPDRPRASIAAGASLIVLASAFPLAQWIAIASGGLAGLAWCRGGPPAAASSLPIPVTRIHAWLALAAFALLLLGLPAIVALSGSQGLALFDAFYRAGALVFGGGHVVLPLLRAALVAPGWIGDDAFLAGYGAARAVPGPLFSVAAYLGELARPGPGGFGGAALGLAGIFLPGMLILLAALPFWEGLRRRETAQAAMRGINAAVVGLLGAALYNPVFTSAVKTSSDLGIALLCFVLLTTWKAPPLLVVVVGALAALAFSG